MLDERSDDELAELVRDALERGDPVPDAMHQAALSAFAFRDLDSALAQLVGDSMAGVRDLEDGPLVFAVEHAEIAVAVEDGRLIGQVAPPAACAGSVEQAKGSPVTFQTDELGRFAVEIPPGPARIVIDHPGGRVRTDWFPV
jgi:hypothetical protein